jgi:hypothetical protein
MLPFPINSALSNNLDKNIILKRKRDAIGRSTFERRIISCRSVLMNE